MVQTFNRNCLLKGFFFFFSIILTRGGIRILENDSIIFTIRLNVVFLK